jgi:hypothetical protein
MKIGLQKKINYIYNMNEEFLSLFDYLGKPAGTALGKEVFEACKLQSQPYQLREISNQKYTGKVILYKKSFLQEYFNSLPIDNLPF